MMRLIRVCLLWITLCLLWLSSVPIGYAKSVNKDFVIVIDPGHGGIDSGAIGVTGILEKDITLSFAEELKKNLMKYHGVKVFLTRNRDIYLHLEERMNLARNLGAQLFISIHADTISDPDLRGATVYTISDQASDLVAKKLSENQNKVDFLVGIPHHYSDSVPSILLDLTRRESYNYSVSFARSLLNNLTGKIQLINNPHRYADFQVLKAPDFPSVLVELGYLSNKQDEDLLSSPQWNKKVAAILAQAIDNFVKKSKL